MKFRIYVTQCYEETGEVEIEADDEREACNLIEEGCYADDIEWDRMEPTGALEIDDVADLTPKEDREPKTQKDKGSK